MLGYLNEVSFQPGVITDSFVHTLLFAITSDVGMGYVRELGGGVVPPDDHMLHLIGSHTATFSNLPHQIKNKLGWNLEWRTWNEECGFRIGGKIWE